MATQSKSWQVFERFIADIFGTFRTPLSGVNSRHNAGDIILIDNLSLLCECKVRGNSVHWTMYREACADAKKNGIATLNTLLFLKVRGAHGSIVTMDTEKFAQIFAVPGVKELFQK